MPCAEVGLWESQGREWGHGTGNLGSKVALQGPALLNWGLGEMYGIAEETLVWPLWVLEPLLDCWGQLPDVDSPS